MQVQVNLRSIGACLVDLPDWVRDRLKGDRPPVHFVRTGGGLGLRHAHGVDPVPVSPPIDDGDLSAVIRQLNEAIGQTTAIEAGGVGETLP